MSNPSEIGFEKMCLNVPMKRWFTFVPFQHCLQQRALCQVEFLDHSVLYNNRFRRDDDDDGDAAAVAVVAHVRHPNEPLFVPQSCLPPILIMPINY